MQYWLCAKVSMTFLRNEDLEMLSLGRREWCLNRKQVLFAVMYVADFVIYMVLLMSAARLLVRAYDIVVHSQDSYRLVVVGGFVCFVIFAVISEKYLNDSRVRKKNDDEDDEDDEDEDDYEDDYEDDEDEDDSHLNHWERSYPHSNSSSSVRTRRYRSCSPVRRRR